MQLLVGTSGFAYREWRGSFYPDKLPAARMLSFYASQLPAVEINNTFYRMPKPTVLAGWSQQVPESFVFALKASRRITHLKRLQDAEEEVAYLYRVAAALGRQRGPILFQLPPYLRADRSRLERFLAALPSEHRAAFEFRHPSWFDPPIFEALRSAGAALCVVDDGGGEPAPIVATAPFGYLRLRGPAYGEAALEGWVRSVRAQPWQHTYVFFKHEDAGTGPARAARFGELFAARAPRRVGARGEAARSRRASGGSPS